MKKFKILFICTHNSFRSQIAEAFVSELLKDTCEANSAGTHPGRIDPLAIEVMKEAGIDISKKKTKTSGRIFGSALRSRCYGLRRCQKRIPHNSWSRQVHS